MNVASADKWSSSFALDVANKIASCYGVYCGPASVGWIAAVWNNIKCRPYDVLGRLNDKTLFPDGPRDFHRNVPGFQMNLSDLLRRETQNDLKLDSRLYFKHHTIHRLLDSSGMPFIIRMPSPQIKDGLHYVTLYRSDRSTKNRHHSFYWQDNGIYRSSEPIGEGLSKSGTISMGLHFFPWGAKRVTHV
ncbi:MAG: hypothetical protein WKF87_12810 [Chryseolinea sp.]